MIRKIAPFILIILAGLQLCSAEDYPINICMCQLDPHLRKVVDSLSDGQSYPPTPTPESETIAATITTTGEDTGSANNTQMVNDTQTATIQSDTAVVAQARKKREANSEDDTETVHELGVIAPTGGVVYDSNAITLTDDQGIKYDVNYNASLCFCKKRNGAELAFCLLNVPYNASVHTDPKSPECRQHIDNLLPWLDETFRKRLDYYLRVLPLKFSEAEGHLQPHFRVELSDSDYSLTYSVRTAFETPEVRNEKLLSYEVDSEDKSCFIVIDITPAIPHKKTLMEKIQYLFLVIPIAVCVGLCVAMCCGKRDQFYVRFW